MKRLVLLRPEPGLSASRDRALALGLEVEAHPLFEIQPVRPEIPEGHFDALVVTSANAARQGRDVLQALGALPTYAVGEATAEALREAGVSPMSVGRGGVEGLDLPTGRLLHLTGEHHRPLPGDVETVVVYRSVRTATDLPNLADKVVAVHSPRAGRRLAEVVGSGRASTVVAAISPAAADACGTGWAAVHAASSPDDEALLALAAALCQSATP